MPFMDEPPVARVSTAASGAYGTLIRALRSVLAGAYIRIQRSNAS